MTDSHPTNWLDAAIDKARKEGAFDDLPNTGKPLKLDSGPQTEYDMAFTMLKNAGAAPFWMQLQQEADAFRAKMDDLIRRNREFVAEQLAPAPPKHAAPRVSLWERIFGRDSAPLEQRRYTLHDLRLFRDDVRSTYLEMAAELDAKLTQYHSSLPSGLWHLQRYRKSVEEHQADFEQSFPEVDEDFTRKALDARSQEG